MKPHDNSAMIAFVNSEIAGLGRACLRFRGARIVSIGTEPERDDHVVDLQGDRLLPGLINAHDHLHRNHYPRLKYRDYDNASQWAADIDARRESDPQLLAGAAVPRADQLLVGAFKNLLAGVTTVVHHDAPHPALESPEFPVHVPRGHGWAHSLDIDGEERVRASHRATPPGQPWFIHAGEGTDAAAAAELAKLEALGCLAGNCFIVHGVAFDAPARARLLAAGAKLVWCPTSNLFLLGRTAEVTELMASGNLLLGTDSRLSGAGGLLEELSVARDACGASSIALEKLVTSNAARLLGLNDRGELRAGARADLVIVPRGLTLDSLARTQIRCILHEGRMVAGDDNYAERLLAPERRVRTRIDGTRRVLDADLARRARKLPLDGVEVEEFSMEVTAA
jgi:cytosine/adenosine deaminase-related metal-dependent hydrolase